MELFKHLTITKWETRAVMFFSFGLGATTGFMLRDELTMPTYMRLKMATIEHRMLARQRLNRDLLTMLDPNEGKY